ncbi:nucleotidyltransferase family protein [Shewanella frigidimarina]|uniref:nucleotidyltransferase family protein n=1 Tax=Shewanella frigidimarina TaxID=56812 RepID=UPI003D7BF608
MTRHNQTLFNLPLFNQHQFNPPQLNQVAIDQLQQGQAKRLSLLWQWLQQDETRLTALMVCQKVMQQQGITDWLISAGFIRNLIWDNLHGLASQALNDIDVIYWRDNNPSSAEDQAIQAMLIKQIDLPWSVKNQARMHLRNGDMPYISCADAMSFWPEKQTAIGVKLVPCDDHTTAEFQLQVISVFDLSCLFDLSLSPNPKRDKAIFNQRVLQKEWLTHFPKLSVTE